MLIYTWIDMNIYVCVKGESLACVCLVDSSVDLDI